MYEAQQISGCEKPKGVSVLAYYLPQFHQTDENDEWHGKGFTEWTRVKASQPLFLNHEQPRVPHEDIGYYDLSDISVLERQALMMAKSGISGAIFYHYRFGNGKRVLAEPVERLHKSKEINLKYCLAWCNENWTKRWDGGNHEILMEQKYSPEDALEFITELIPHFKDDRYIRVGDRPLLIIYRPHLIPDLAQYVEIWRGVCMESGMQMPFLVASETWGDLNAAGYLSFFDAVSEKPMYDFPKLNHLKQLKVESFGAKHEGSIFDYEDIVEHYIKNPSSSHECIIPSLNPSWDVSPRHARKALILLNDRPELFQKWLVNSIQRANSFNDSECKFVFINAWNEWAEGAYLEPDKRYGYAYLNSVARATLEAEA